MGKAIAGVWLASMGFAIVAPAFAQSNPATMLIQRNQVLRLQVDEADPGKVPSLRNSEAPSIRSAFDLTAIRALPNDASIGDVCHAVVEATGSFTAYADRVGGSEHAGEAFAEVEDEFVMGEAATIICTAKLYRVGMAVMQGRMVKQPASARNMIRSFRADTIKTLNSTLAGATTMKPANGAMILDALIENIAFVAESLPLVDRKREAEMIRNHQFAHPAARAKLALIAAAFDSTACGSLCRLV